MSNPASRRRSRRKPRAIPLRPLALQSAPFNKRALAWSPDAELAVAADDSVYVFVPQFMSARGDRMHVEHGLGDADENGDDNGEGGDADADVDDMDVDDDDDFDGDDPFVTDTATRSQFAAGSLRIPVANPRLDPRVNRRLYDATPEVPNPFLEQTIRAPAAVDAADAVDNASRAFLGAGSGVLTAAGSTMNSVVSLAWSPAGIGRNRRPVLGVLTASGMLVMYGEALDGGGGAMAETNKAKTATPRGRSSYDTSRWEVLWAVGERMVVPPQQEPGECVASFAWTGGWDGRSWTHKDADHPAGPARFSPQALLVYVTDKSDMVVLGVGHVHSSGSGSGSGSGDAWSVIELTRRPAPGPHGTPQPPMSAAATTLATDPAFVPCGTAFSVQCSPWLVSTVAAAADGQPAGTARTCLVGYIARNYVGFRRLTVRWRPGENSRQHSFELEPQDVAGFCLHLGVDAFLAWEEGIWTEEVEDEADKGQGPGRGKGKGKRKDERKDKKRGVRRKKHTCRCVVATPMVVKTFDVELAAVDMSQPLPTEPAVADHSPDACGSVLPPAADRHTNPIQDLVVHAPDPTRRGREPFYTYVRQSVTDANPAAWHHTNATAFPGGSEDDLQWVEDIQYQLTRNEDDEYDDDEERERAEQEATKDEAEQEARSIATAGGPFQLAPAAAVAPRGRQYRLRLWGLAQAPGALLATRGVTAVLVTEHAAQHADRSSWNRDRSYVMFGWNAGWKSAALRPVSSTLPPPPLSSSGAPPPSPLSYDRPHPSAEARMWTYMYGGGPPVMSWAPARGQQQENSTTAASLQRLVAHQTCTICGASIDTAASAGTAAATATTTPATQLACQNGHVFSRCSTTGLAIQRPNVSRACGVCGNRTLRVDALAQMLEGAVVGSGGDGGDGGEGRDGDLAALRETLLGEVCGRCGGKFHD